MGYYLKHLFKRLCLAYGQVNQYEGKKYLVRWDERFSQVGNIEFLIEPAERAFGDKFVYAYGSTLKGISLYVYKGVDHPIKTFRIPMFVCNDNESYIQSEARYKKWFDDSIDKIIRELAVYQ